MQGLSKTGSDLPEVLVLEILSKLPVKSLTRFRCVCKPWSCSFQTPLFITKHHNNNLRNNNLNLLFKGFQGNTIDGLHYFYQLSTEKGQNFSAKQKFHIPFFGKGWSNLFVDGPCNGILCLNEPEDKVALWNPSTREFKILPQSSVQRPPSADYTSFDGLGFGYDSQTDDYKVLRFVISHFDDLSFDPNHQAELYSLRSDSWKEISTNGVYVRDCPLFNKYLNGFYYWHAAGDSGYLILSFDMVNEKFSTLSLPSTLVQSYWHLLDFNGLLGAILQPDEGTEKSFDLWVMNGSWTKQFTIESVPGVEWPLGFWKNGELFFESSEHQLVLFHPSTRELKNLGMHAEKDTMQITAYVESLVTINGRSEYEERIIRCASN
ncbi:hypothetical protein like AT3G06240 [Hibiscus trionum]|uniref:F-box domain-containing protein n=1 Tax=Hibiscus trionum TaxID=183268 RepID=A0A9W7LRT8_HIBTR|nr:hypothetical protein like AT3G06240 [Hibiscus trionum]